ncbi:hypothetical protein L596_005054 [Steinernema carpocapsae]|uniref:Uncharacterized protein n=1 Tax=Steinernema carpocapsae TaxID=34508 RepID=A0A4U8UYT8_STECR|nr:hypothetical protein L596_005054 [Steinernema carpocapsae]
MSNDDDNDHNEARQDETANNTHSAPNLLHQQQMACWPSPVRRAAPLSAVARTDRPKGMNQHQLSIKVHSPAGGLLLFIYF